MKKQLTALLAGAMLVGSLTGCGGQTGDKAAGKVVTIDFPTYWVGVNTTTEWFADRLKAFEEQYGDQIQVKVEEIAGDQNYIDKMKVLYSSHSLPDAMNTGGYNLIDSMKDQLVDLAPYITDELRTHGAPICWQVNSRGDAVYGIPFTRQVIGYFYNKDLFKQAGIEKPAQTWDEFFTQCETLRKAGITPLSMDTADSGWVTSLWLGAMIASNDAGETFMNTSLPKDYNTPEFLQAATNIQNMFQNYTTPDAVGGAYENAASNFFMGETAMIANGPWMISDFYDTALVPEGFADKVGTAMFPGQVMYNSGKIGFNIASQTEEKLKATLTFVDFLTNKESQTKMLEMTGETPAMEGITSDHIKPLVNEVNQNGDHAKRCINDFQSLWYANVVDEISVQYPLLAQGKITPAQFAEALTTAAQKNT